MNRQQLEYSVLELVNRVEAGAPVEDSRVELKASWPVNHADAARRIAAHANAARGADILWVIGLDEGRGVVGADAHELSDWVAQVRKNFDSVMPDLEDLNVHVGERTLVALLFKTDRAPFVVCNPAYGKPGGGPMALETPWREGTAVRSATRRDLMRLLMPLMALPDVECLHLSARVVRERTFSGVEALRWKIDGELYVAPSSTAVVTFPRHKTAVSMHHSSTDSGVEPLLLGPVSFYLHRAEQSGPAIVHQAGVAFSSAGSVFLDVTVEYRGNWIAYSNPRCEISLEPVGAAAPIRLSISLKDVPPRHQEEGAWSYQAAAANQR